MHVRMPGAEPHRVRTAEMEVCELGKDCSEEDEPAALRNGKGSLKLIVKLYDK